MAVYIIADIDVQDAAGYREYSKRVSATIEAYGGRYLARGGDTTVLEGAWTPHRLVILEFPTREAAETWWNSPEYRPLLEIRQRTSRGSLVLTDGL